MEDLKKLLDIVIILVIACVVYTAFELVSWVLSLLNVCIGAC